MNQEDAKPNKEQQQSAPKLHIDLSKYKKASNQSPSSNPDEKKTISLDQFEKGSLQEKYATQKK